MKLTPESKKIEELASKYPIIPICKEIYADVITPISLLQKIAKQKKQYFLLESVEQGKSWGRYSFLGFDPKAKIAFKDNEAIIEENGKISRLNKKPYELLREYMRKYKSPKLDELPPFTGGLVGYFSYSMIGIAEPKLHLKNDEFSNYNLMLFDKVIAYDHLKQKILIIVNMQTDNILENYGKAVQEIEQLNKFIVSEMNFNQYEAPIKTKFECNFTPDEYYSAVEKTKEYIRNGDIFQAVISRKFESEYKGSMINAYRVLRTTNPSPYMVYICDGDDEIMSASPETLVSVQNGTVTTFPIAGSRPRGETYEEDKKLEEELFADEKELSEHNMLVDLGRNDIGKISKVGSVKVTRYMNIQKYSRIMHICSEVQGKIRDDADIFDAIESVLPAGTLSGAPKIRACEIINELEKCPRGIYGGALGYIGFTGNMDTCIAIRMAVKKNGRVSVQAGGGIVADSIPENEYLESENKAKAVINALINANEVNE